MTRKTDDAGLRDWRESDRLGEPVPQQPIGGAPAPPACRPLRLPI
jgi:hypothetical protein